MKIGIDASFMAGNITGIGFNIYNTISSMAEIDHDTTFYVYLNSKPNCELELPDNWHIRYSKDINFFVWQLFILPKWVKEDDIDVLWEPCNRIPRVPANIKLVLTVNDLGSYLYREYCSLGTYILERLFLKKSCMRADKIIAISDYTSNDLQKYFGIHEDKIIKIYCGGGYDEFVNNSPNDVFSELKTKYKIINPFFLVMGTISNRKNPFVILNAFKQYKEDGGQKQLVFAGKNALKKGVFERAIEQLNIEEDVIVTGYITEEEKICLYKNADAMLLPSRYEGFGYPILEAMSIGTPVITTRITSLPEVGGDVVLYLDDIDDYEELARLFIQNEKMSVTTKDKIIEEGKKRAKLFTKEKCANSTLLVLKGLMQ